MVFSKKVPPKKLDNLSSILSIAQLMWFVNIFSYHFSLEIPKQVSGGQYYDISKH